MLTTYICHGLFVDGGNVRHFFTVYLWTGEMYDIFLGLGLGLDMPLFECSSYFLCLACLYRPVLSFKTIGKVIHDCFVEISTL